MEMFGSYASSCRSFDSENVSHSDIDLIYSYSRMEGQVMAISDTYLSILCSKVTNIDFKFNTIARVKAFYRDLFNHSL